jgi:hypothetical protein
LGGNVSKHVALVGELSRLVNAKQLLAVSELEQSLAANESHGADLKVRSFPLVPRASMDLLKRIYEQMLQSMITSPDIPLDSKLRLSILYALRYQKFNQNNIPGVVDLLKQQNVPDVEVRFAVIYALESQLTCHYVRQNRWFTACSISQELINDKMICLRTRTSSVGERVP